MGYRLGLGGGYFDRTLAALCRACQTCIRNHMTCRWISS
ncbi:MAG TPA: hypothetical protein VIV84_10390 [Burkholderiaceae bacterium]